MPDTINPAIIPEPARQTLAALCRKYRVRTLALFGSAAGTAFDPATSDIDLLAGFEPMPPGEHMQNYFRLSEDLEKLFRRSVDLVEPSAVRNPYVMASIQKSRVTVYATA